MNSHYSVLRDVCYSNKTIFIAGGAGSFGNAVLNILFIAILRESAFLVMLEKNRVIGIKIILILC